jgi:hypothetical protein
VVSVTEFQTLAELSGADAPVRKGDTARQRSWRMRAYRVMRLPISTIHGGQPRWRDAAELVDLISAVKIAATAFATAPIREVF